MSTTSGDTTHYTFGANINPGPTPTSPSRIDTFPNYPPPLYDNIPLGSDIARRQAERNREKQAMRDRTMALSGPIRPLPLIPSSSEIRDPSVQALSSDRQRYNQTTEFPTSDDIPTSNASAEAIVSVNEAQWRESGLSMASTAEEFLPEGMDVREALARCEDPTLGWSLQFWITIADPVTQHVFYACPATGQTSWVPPVGVFIVPRQPEGEWWELADTTRGNRSYFYNTLTKKTQWTRPGENQFVIPLGLIQSSASPVRGERRSRMKSAASADHLRANNPLSRLAKDQSRSRFHSDPPNAISALGPRPPPSPRRDTPRTPDAVISKRTDTSTLGVPESESTSSLSSSPEISSPQMPRRHTPSSPENPITPRNFAQALSVVREGDEVGRSIIEDEGESGNEADHSVVSGRSAQSQRTVRKPDQKRGAMKLDSRREIGRGFLGMLGRRGRSSTTPEFSSANRDQRIVPPIMPWIKRNASTTSVGTSSPIGWPVPHHPNHSVPTLPIGIPSAPIPIDTTLRSKRMSTGLHPLLPSAISADIQNFRGPEFAALYFATRRSGILWQKLPLDKVLEWQKQPISGPLLNGSKGAISKDAIMCFKVIQRTMGERDRPVEGVRTLARSTRMPDGAIPGAGSAGGRWIVRRGTIGGQSDKMVVLEEIRWMIQACVVKPELRDEVYCQVVKQVTKNPTHEAIILGFQLFSVLASAFSPGKNFLPFIKSFLENHLDSTDNGIAKMARYALTKMATTNIRYGRGRQLTIGEIEHASDAAFYPSVYGESLSRIMRDQSASHPTDKIPVILPFLANVILQLNGLESEGIFRIPGDGDVVAELKSRMDRGHYHFAGIDDPHIATSLFKLWLRELEEPLIPIELYNNALTSASNDNPDRAIAFVHRLPTHNRRVLLFVIAFFQLFCGNDVVARTKMTPNNLALVLAPNILRTTSDSLVVAYTNSAFESRFVHLLLQHLDVSKVDEGYAPKVELDLIT